MGPGVAQWLRRCATSRKVPGSTPGGVTWDFFRGSFRQSNVPWGRLSFWKWVTGISPAVKAAGAFGWRPTTLVMPKVEMIRGLNLPGTPRANSACHGITLLNFLLQRYEIFPAMLLGCDPVSLGKWCSTFRKIPLPPSSELTLQRRVYRKTQNNFMFGFPCIIS